MLQVLQNLGFLEGLLGLICLEDSWLDNFDSVLLLGDDMLTKEDLTEAALAELFYLVKHPHIKFEVKGDTYNDYKFEGFYLMRHRQQPFSDHLG